MCPTCGCSVQRVIGDVVHTCMVGRGSDLKDAVRGEMVDVVDPVHSRKQEGVYMCVCGCVWMTVVG